MIMTVEEYKALIDTSESDQVIQSKIQAVELLIRKFTNNNFQNRNIRIKCPIMQTKLYGTSNMMNVGDTIQISSSLYSDGIYTITEKDDEYITLNKELFDESEVLATLVVYPDDVKMGVVNMLKWDQENRSKIGIQSETISRHSVTYFNMDGDNSMVGYPKSLTGFLKPYMKARF